MALSVKLATIRRAWIRTGLLGTAIFITWSLVAYRAQASAQAALETDSRVTVIRTSDAWSFTPPDPAPVGLLFFPGALVDPVAYAPLVHAIAAAGYTSLLIEVPWRGAFGGAEGPEVFARARVAAARTRIARWIVAGHSRGGVIASYVVRDGFPGLAGAVLLGTSHPRDFSLAGTPIPMTRVFGTRDTVADVEKLDRTRANLPASTRIVRIDGGNHSQFGYYGFQPGDWPATISRDAQQAIIRGAILDALAAAAR
jgi:alpha-beta hydrolase superfamily lysophospholipase